MSKLASAGMAAVAAIPAWGFTALGIKGFLDGAGDLPGSITPLLGVTTALCAGVGMSPAYFLLFGKSDPSAAVEEKTAKGKKGEAADEQENTKAAKKSKGAVASLESSAEVPIDDSSSEDADGSGDFAEVSSSEMHSMAEMDESSGDVDEVAFDDSGEMETSNFDSSADFDHAALSADEIAPLDDSAFELEGTDFAEDSSEEIEFEEPAPKKKGKKK